MTKDDFRVGARVRLHEDVHIFALGSVPRLSEGTVISLHPHPALGDPFAEVLMDDRFRFLSPWANRLQVYQSADACSEVTEEAFEPIGFG